LEDKYDIKTSQLPAGRFVPSCGETCTMKDMDAQGNGHLQHGRRMALLARHLTVG
jgi:hypothetical protein